MLFVKVGKITKMEIQHFLKKYLSWMINSVNEIFNYPSMRSLGLHLFGQQQQLSDPHESRQNLCHTDYPIVHLNDS